MATPTYDLIDSVTLSATATSVSFTGIGSSYRDLVLVAQHSASSQSYLSIRFNDDSGTNYPIVWMAGVGTLAASNSSDTYDRLLITQSYTNTQDNQWIMQILDYAQTDKHKALLIRQNEQASGWEHTSATASRWESTSALTKIQIWPNYTLGSGNFTIGSTFHLYGIAG